MRLFFLSCFALALGLAPAHAADKKILLVAGKPSHGAGEHEFNAGVQLLAKCLAGAPGIKTEVVLNAGPLSDEALAGADAIVIYCDGEYERNHPALFPQNLARIDAAAARGAGIGFLHYAVEPTSTVGRAEFLRWTGGYFETDRSVNPHWTANYASFPMHPITRGVKPFAVLDEWYFYLRFTDHPSLLTPLLVAVPPAETMSRKDGKHEGNPEVRAAVARGEAQTMAWAFERPGGGRGFGFTGGHAHRNWGNDDFRKFVLNAIVWLAHGEVPANGVQSKVIDEDLAANLDPKPVRKQAEKK